MISEQSAVHSSKAKTQMDPEETIWVLCTWSFGHAFSIGSGGRVNIDNIGIWVTNIRHLIPIRCKHGNLWKNMLESCLAWPLSPQKHNLIGMCALIQICKAGIMWIPNHPFQASCCPQYFQTKGLLILSDLMMNDERVAYHVQRVWQWQLIQQWGIAKKPERIRLYSCAGID